jgi:hypothetical protein
MKFAERHHFFHVVDACGLGPDQIEARVEANGATDRIGFDIPEDHARVVPFAKFLMSLAAPETGLMMMPVEHGIWQSSENWHLYDTLRRAHHDSAPLWERPCHCFSAEEMDIALDFLCLFILFSWGFYVFSYKKEDILFLSHDGFGTYFSPSRIEYLVDRVETDLPRFFEKNYGASN